jgi:hypothetical protein
VATQRLTVATLAGQAAAAATARFEQWRARPGGGGPALRVDPRSRPVLAGGVLRRVGGPLADGRSGPRPRRDRGPAVSGRLLFATQATGWAERCGDQFAEQAWLANRLREAAAGWGGMAEPYAVVVREAVGASVTDDEVQAAAETVPSWLSPADRDVEPL